MEIFTKAAGLLLLSFLLLRLMVSIVNLLWKRYTNKTFNRYLKSEISPSEKWSILIPARDEQDNIANILSDIEKLENKPFEVIVYNDNSADNTEAVAISFSERIPGLKVIGNSIDKLPQGWLGKNRACHELASFASGDYILFIDADVRLSGNIAGKYINYLKEKNLSLLSIFPKQILPNFASKISTPLMNWILLSLLPLPLVRLCSWPSFSAANGQFMLFKADTYNQLKPHMQFSGSRAEDIEIARWYKRKKKRVATLTGDHSVECCMYQNLEDAFNGFSKNVFHFFGNSVFITILFAIITTITPLYLSLFNGALLAFISLIAIILIRIFISMASEQNIIENIRFLIHQHLIFIFIIIKAMKHRAQKNLIWKGRNIITFLLVFISLFAFKCADTQESYRSRIYKSFINGDMVSWERVVKEMESIVTIGESDRDPLKIELLNYYYGLAGYLISQKESKKAAAYCDKGEKIIEDFLKKNPSDATFIAYRTAFMGFRIGLNNLKAVTLGIQSMNLSKRALSIDSLNVQALTERGNVLYYSPSFAGGDKLEGISFYLKAASVIEKSGDTKENWFYLSLLTNIGRSYKEIGLTSRAKATYEKILKAEPNYKWVRDDLLLEISALIRDSSLPVCPAIDVFSSALLNRYGSTSLTGA
jgi:glycosyltransferase involved in cell wall biosynthesis